jgi:hypothetical protein
VLQKRINEAVVRDDALYQTELQPP